MAFEGQQNQKDDQYRGYEDKGQGNSIKVYWKDYPYACLIKTSLVFLERLKGYKSPYLAFISAWPKAGDTYLKDHHVTFMFELPLLNAFGKALRSRCAPGGHTLGKYEKWADATKAAIQGENSEARSSKKLVVKSQPDGKISLCFNRGKGQNQGKHGTYEYGVSMLLENHDAAALADDILFMHQKGRDLDFDLTSKAALYIIEKKVRAARQQNQQGGFQQSQQSRQGGYQQSRQQTEENGYQQSTQAHSQDQAIPDQQMLREKFPFLPVIDEVWFDVFSDAQRQRFIRAQGAVEQHFNELIQAGFAYTDNCPFWWRRAA